MPFDQPKDGNGVSVVAALPTTKGRGRSRRVLTFDETTRFRNGQKDSEGRWVDGLKAGVWTGWCEMAFA